MLLPVVDQLRFQKHKRPPERPGALPGRPVKAHSSEVS